MFILHARYFLHLIIRFCQHLLNISFYKRKKIQESLRFDQNCFLLEFSFNYFNFNSYINVFSNFQFFSDECTETPNYPAEPTYFCPNKCIHKPKGFTGNIRDPYNQRHFVACLNGALVGCIKCPGGLKYNQKWNACLYEGKFKTEAVKMRGDYVGVNNDDDDDDFV